MNPSEMPTELTLHLRPHASAPGRARSAVAPLRPQLPADVFENLRLLVTELVTNSVRHAGLGDDDEVRVSVRLLPDRVAVACMDAGPGYDPPERGPGHDPAEGWGLYLVEVLADRWGTGPEGHLVRTWFELDLPG
jgi:anti-sigma regulatory factor (Ser/Thr protein kinase)